MSEHRIGEYTIVRELGRGGMGLVYEAHERLSGRPVALKVMHDKVAASDRGRQLFLSEMSILGTLDHPNVVRLLAGFEHQSQFVMVLELIRGQTLRQLIRTAGRLAWTDAVAIARQVLQGLAAAHERSPPVVHRDLKPVNVMVTYEGVAKVMDFGIAKVVQGETHATTDVGTMRYMSPEQIDGRLIDARSDLYAVGLLLYEMLTGAPPFRSQSTRELLTMQCTAPVPPLPPEVAATCPSDLFEIVRTLLSKSADERPASARVTLTMLESLGPAELRVFPAPHPPQNQAAPSSNFPGASGWSTASSWGNNPSSSWGPTGATPPPAPATNLPTSPGGAMPGSSGWQPSSPGAPSQYAPTHPPSPSPTPPSPAQVRVDRSRPSRLPWVLAAVAIAIPAVGTLAYFALASDDAPEPTVTANEDPDPPPKSAAAQPKKPPPSNDAVTPKRPASPPDAPEPEKETPAPEQPTETTPPPTLPEEPQARIRAICKDRVRRKRAVSRLAWVGDIDGDGTTDVVAQAIGHEAQHLLVGFSGKTVKPLWEVELPEFYYHVGPQASRHALAVPHDRILRVYDPRTGHEHWKKRLSDDVTALAVRDDQLQVLTLDLQLVRLDTKTGSERKSGDVLSELTYAQGFQGTKERSMQAPAIDGYEQIAEVGSFPDCRTDLLHPCRTPPAIAIYKRNRGSSRPKLVRTDGDDIRWSVDFEDIRTIRLRPASFSNLNAAANDALVVFAHSSHEQLALWAYDADTGRELWTLQVEIQDSNLARIQLAEDRLFVLTDCLLALDPRTGEVLAGSE